MRPGARIASAVDVLEDVLKQHRPVALALNDWGKSHRFAGSGDRAAIGNLVYDALRQKLSFASIMDDDSARALILAATPTALGISASEIAGHADGTQYALAQLTEKEVLNLNRRLSDEEPDYVRGNIPPWLIPSFKRAFGDHVVAEGDALSKRAPLDLRTNMLKTGPQKLISRFIKYDATPGRFASAAVRLPAPKGAGRTPNVVAEPSHARGWFEIQDEGSQIATSLTGAGPGMQVLDLCAGAGGKTLALAAAMQNTGQIFAYDSDKKQLRPIFERLRRAGVRNAQVLEPGDEESLRRLGPRFDIVLVDAPCTGTGVWRRRPDSKWRLKPRNLSIRIEEQKRALLTAHQLVRPGGHLVYVTCSVLPEENSDQVEWLLRSAPHFTSIPRAEVLSHASLDTSLQSADGSPETFLLTPEQHGTDGFFVACLRRAR
ncbi:MAG: RsmB/NOP family class I SAM-dependent RNA methyltransferase [Hyphomicrobiaceae bacterium]